MNYKSTTNKMATSAAKILNNSHSSNIQRKLAGSVLSQANTEKQSGSYMEDLASKVLSSQKYNQTTKSLAGSVVSQSNKER